MTRPRKSSSTVDAPEWAKALRDRRFHLGLSQEQVEEKSGGVIAQKTVSAVENGSATLLGMALSRAGSYARALNWTLKDMQEATGLDFGVPASEPSWVLAGTGDKPHPPFHFQDGAIQKELDLIPVFGLAAAGPGVYNEDREAIGYMYVAREFARHPNRVTFMVEGESMAPTIEHGDAVHVDRSDTDLHNEKVFLVEVLGNGYVVKRAREYGPDDWELVSDNPKFKALRPTEARVMGRVFGVSPQMRKL